MGDRSGTWEHATTGSGTSKKSRPRAWEGERRRRVAFGCSGDRASFCERLKEGPQEPVDLASEVYDSHQPLDLSAGDQRGPQEGHS